MAEINTSIWLINPTEPEERWYYALADCDMAVQGWFRVGDRCVSFTPPTRKEVAGPVVQSLQARLAEIRLKAEKDCRTIEGAIQNMLCLTYESVPVDDDIPF